MIISDYINHHHLIRIRKKVQYFTVRMDFSLVVYFKNGMVTRYINVSDSALNKLEKQTEEIVDWSIEPANFNIK